jgi:hypothetical protein
VNLASSDDLRLQQGWLSDRSENQQKAGASQPHHGSKVPPSWTELHYSSSTASNQEKAMLGQLGTARTCLHCMMLRVTEGRLVGFQLHFSHRDAILIALSQIDELEGNISSNGAP